MVLVELESVRSVGPLLSGMGGRPVFERVRQIMRRPKQVPAATLLAVDGEGSLLGGAILPGPQIALAALVANTAQLPQVAPEAAPRNVLGTNTAASLQSGIVYGTAAQLDGMAARLRAALGAPAAPVIATGSLPASIRAACEVPIRYEETLVLDGLHAIWQKNRKKA